MSGRRTGHHGSMGGNRLVTRKVAHAEARAARAELRRVDYQARKEAGRCTREGCDRMADDGTNLCGECGPAVRDRVRKAVALHRSRRREEGRCRECGDPSPTCQCIDCQIRLGDISKRALARIIGGGNRLVTRPEMDTRIEKDPRYPDGRLRTRYRGGQGRRGAPTKAAVDAADITLAIASLVRAREKLDALCGIEDKRARQALRAEALAQVALAGRQIDEVVERSGG